MESLDARFSDGQAEVFVASLPSGRRRVWVEPRSPRLFVPFFSCVTTYPLALIQKILSAKGAAYLIDEILRDESPGYVQHDLKWSLLAYADEAEFADARILDFGCGSGSSSMTLARMFPSARIVGIELEERLLSVARARAQFYRCDNLSFGRSSAPSQLPPDMGLFDFVVLSAVYEHLLPAERKALMPRLWHLLKPGGVLFLNATPNRNFPLEMHTTGLPFINYLPDKWALAAARHLSRRNLEHCSWNDLLRAGIRGGTIKDIVAELSTATHPAEVLEPRYCGTQDRIDLWFQLTSNSIGRARSPFALAAKRCYRRLMKPVKSITGFELLPELALAFRKQRALENRSANGI
ncbi:MAG TPA: class I SAM-dependent methyltransferase [Rhodocyclaceae bacterium]|nr:class I SAM-dependent methyltransferase [Rhodocyclaceae bacterium]